MATKTKQIIDALAKKKITVDHAEYSRDLGWCIWIDPETPVHGMSPIVGRNFQEVNSYITNIKRRYDNCPRCYHPIGYEEEKLKYCENCETSFKDLI